MTGKAAGSRIRVWDLPTRIFHWLLVPAVVGAVVTANIGGNLMECHGKLGLLIVGLVAFRLVWGIAGSTYSRFSTFLPNPRTAFAYVKGEWKGLGHNPLGALSVLALLGILALQAGTGLFANDDIAYEGYFFSLIGKDLSDRLTGIHHLAATLLYILVGLHLAAIAFYLHVKKDNLIRPMVTGWKEAEESRALPASGGGIPALVVALAIAAGAVWAASGEWIAEPPPPAAAPAW